MKMLWLILLMFSSLNCFGQNLSNMQSVYLGAAPKDGTGDNLPLALGKLNTNVLALSNAIVYIYAVVATNMTNLNVLGVYTLTAANFTSLNATISNLSVINLTTTGTVTNDAVTTTNKWNIVIPGNFWGWTNTNKFDVDVILDNSGTVVCWDSAEGWIYTYNNVSNCFLILKPNWRLIGDGSLPARMWFRAWAH
jgi:hypothetical protein